MREERHLRIVNGGNGHQEQAYDAAERAQRLLAQPATLDAYNWAWVATLIVEADDALNRAQEHDRCLGGT